MARVVALLAAVIATFGLGACGDEDGAEPGASRSEATLVLDFQPNAVHSGLYAAKARGDFERRGVDVEIREPSSSTDAPKLLQAGRADFAILDISDAGIAAGSPDGYDLVAVAAIVQVPLAAVIARGDEGIETPADLEGRTVGVTGLPSDDAVLDAVVDAAGGDPAEVDRTTIGFDSIAALSAGRVDAATAFWNAEGVALHDLGVETNEFRVADILESPYPELVLVTSRRLFDEQPELVDAVVAGLAQGTKLAADDPSAALEDLLAEVPGLDRDVQRAQLDALTKARAFTPAAGLDPAQLDPAGIESWFDFAQTHEILTPDEAEKARQAFTAE